MIKLGKITFDGLPTLFVPSQISNCSKPGPRNPILSPKGEPDSPIGKNYSIGKSMSRETMKRSKLRYVLMEAELPKNGRVGNLSIELLSRLLVGTSIF